MMPATPGVAQAADRRRGRTRRRRRAPRRRSSAASARRAARGPARAPPWARTNAADAAVRELGDERPASVGGAGRCHGNAASRSGRGSRPTASQSPATSRQLGEQRRIVGDAHRQARPASRRPRTRAGCCRRPRAPPATWIGIAIRDAIAPTASRLAGAPRPRAVEVDEVDHPRAALDEAARRSAPAGRSARRRRPRRPARRRPASGRASRSIEGMTCTSGASGPARSRPAPARAEPAAPSPAAIRSRRSRRWKLIGSEPLREQRVVEAAQENARARAGAARPPGAGAAAPCRAGTRAGRSACTCSGGPRPGRWPPRSSVCSTRNSDRLVDGDLAAVHPDVEDDPARPPDRVRVHVQPEVRGVVEALLAHHLLGVHAPALDELRGVGQRAGSGSGGGSRPRAGGGGPGRPRGCWCC